MTANARRLTGLETRAGGDDVYYMKLPGNVYVKTSPGSPQVEITEAEYAAAAGKVYTALPAARTD